MHNAIGIHSANETLRIAELTRTGGAVSVVSLRELPAGTSPESGEAPSFAMHNGRSPAGVASLGRRDVLTRVWSMPVVDEAKLRLMVQHRLEAELPIPMEQLTWSLRIAGQAADGQRLVLAQATRAERMTEHLYQLARLDFWPRSLTSEHEALASLARHGLEPPLRHAVCGLVLAGAEEWLVCVFQGELARAVRRISVASRPVEMICRELHQIFAGEIGSSPDHLTIACCAPDSDFSAIKDASLRLGMEIVPARFNRLQDATGRPLDPATLLQYGPAIGLALAELFAPAALVRLGGHDEVSSRSTGRWDRWLAYPRRLAGASVALLFTATVAHVWALRSETNRMNLALETSVAAVAPGLDQKVRAMQRADQYRLDVEGIMSGVCAAIPDSIILSSVQLSRDHRLILKGTSQDATAAFSLADALRKSPRFLNVNPERAAPGQGGDFTVSAELAGVQKLGVARSGGAGWR